MLTDTDIQKSQAAVAVNGNGKVQEEHKAKEFFGKKHVRRAAVEAVVFMVLAIGGGLLFWGSSFANNMVHDQLASQQIFFPQKGSAGFSATEFPGLQRYAGQLVDNGPKAKAFANEYIAVHLKGISNGETYSQVSAKSLANPKDAALAAKTQTLFRGETLRGLLLYAWGWSVIGSIAFWVSLAAFAGAAVVLIAVGYSVVRPHTA